MRKLLFTLSLIPMISLANAMPPEKPNCPSKTGARFEQNMKGPEKRDMRFLEKLDLTEAQITQIKEIKDSSRAKMMGQKHQEKMLHQELRWLSASMNYDVKKVDDLITQLTEVKANQLKQRVEMQHQIFNLLTDDQKVKMSMIQKVSLLEKY